MATDRRLRTNVKQIAEMLKSLLGSNNKNNMSKHVQFIACLSLCLSVFLKQYVLPLFQYCGHQSGPAAQCCKGQDRSRRLWQLSQRVRLADLVQLTSEMKGFHLNNQTMDHIVLPHTHTLTRTQCLWPNNGKSDLVRQQVTVGSLEIDELCYKEKKGLY